MTVKYNVGLKTLLQQGISEPVFHGDLVYKFKKKTLESNQLKTLKHYKRAGYSMDVMRQLARLVINLITVYRLHNGGPDFKRNDDTDLKTKITVH